MKTRGWLIENDADSVKKRRAVIDAVDDVDFKTASTHPFQLSLKTQRDQ